MQIVQSRRRFLTTAAFASAAAMGGIEAASVADARKSFATEMPPEVSAVRLGKIPGLCIAPQYVAEELLRAEGFTDIHYLPAAAGTEQAQKIAHGDVDFTLNFATPLIIPLDAGEPITVLAGTHVGCFELLGSEGIRSIADLKGRSVGVQSLNSSPYMFLTGMASYVGLDPIKDIHWVTNPSVKPMQLFVEGKIDAFLGFPPEPQELRARNIGHVIVNSSVTRPWSQYFCCMLAGNKEFVRSHPIATKRVLRAILKATDLCVSEPERVAQLMVDRGFAAALKTLNEVPYGVWRDYDPEDTIRFYALRLYEAGLSNPARRRLSLRARTGDSSTSSSAS